MDHNLVLSYDYAKVNECPSSVDHVDGHGLALKRYMWHRPVQHVQGYTGSHWTPPLGDYSLRIALAAARATANKTTMYHVHTLMAISVVIAMRRYYTACITRWRRSRAFI